MFSYSYCFDPNERDWHMADLLSTNLSLDEDSGSSQRSLPKERTRTPNWTPEEVLAFLELREEALEVVKKGSPWEWISSQLETRHQMNRTAKGCENHWTTLMRSYKRIAAYNGECGESKCHLPQAFPQEWYDMMERILAAQFRSRQTRSTAPDAAPTRIHLGRLPTSAVTNSPEQGENAALMVATIKRSLYWEMDVDTKSACQVPPLLSHLDWIETLKSSLESVVWPATAAVLQQGREDRKQRLKLIAKEEHKLASLQKAKGKRLKGRHPPRRALTTKFSGNKSAHYPGRSCEAVTSVCA